MTEEELRALVRAAIARELGVTAPPHLAEPAAAPRAHPRGGVAPAHPSHVLLTLAASVEPGSACIIEPVVTCTHCGYCRSYGH